jgi:ornithine--oxo-acid transaminase
MVIMAAKRHSSKEFIALEEQYGAHNYHPLDVVVQRAKGSWIWDVDGRKYLDCLAAYSAVNQGHCHPKILKAMQSQLKKVTLTSRAFRNDQLPLLYKKLHDLAGFDMSLPMNSGAEAVETAIKAARKWGYKVKGIPENQAEIVCATDNFHGRTTTIISFSTDSQSMTHAPHEMQLTSWTRFSIVSLGTRYSSPCGIGCLFSSHGLTA